MSTALVWFRRDFRLTDNPALHTACIRHARVVPVYIHAPEEEAPWQSGGASQWWLHHSLRALNTALTRLGTPLVIRRGETRAELQKLIEDSGASGIYWNRLYEPALTARDKTIKKALHAQGLTAESFNSALLCEPWMVKTGAGAPYRVFSPFWRAVSARLPADPIMPAPATLTGPALPGLKVEELQLLPRIPWDQGFYPAWTPGEAGAQARLETFCGGAAARYREQRDLPGEHSTSGLSPHLHFGEIGPRQIIVRVQAEMTGNTAAGALASYEHYIRELGWREFAHHLLYHYPGTPLAPLHAARFGRFPWRRSADYAADLAAWQQGRTGIPIVDAGMRELWHTGWMHNRVRMIVASFLTKNLLIPWQEGARWFWDTLVDADLANNTLGWQWAAGCGADAAPYYRIFNPILQSQKFDPQGRYLRRWLPELASLPDSAIHTPWQADAMALRKAGVKQGETYPQPVVDLAESRQRALAAFDTIKHQYKGS